jgi:hypothetical protein
MGFSQTTMAILGADRKFDGDLHGPVIWLILCQGITLFQN